MTKIKFQISNSNNARHCEKNVFHRGFSGPIDEAISLSKFMSLSKEITASIIIPIRFKISELLAMTDIVGICEVRELEFQS